MQFLICPSMRPGKTSCTVYTLGKRSTKASWLQMRVASLVTMKYENFLLKIMPETTKQKTHIAFTLNGESAEVAFAPHKTLLEVLREDLGLTGTKHGCELGECGTCTVLVDGR